MEGCRYRERESTSQRVAEGFRDLPDRRPVPPHPPASGDVRTETVPRAFPCPRGSGHVEGAPSRGDNERNET
jgi:hypothetical protein